MPTPLRVAAAVLITLATAGDAAAAGLVVRTFDLTGLGDDERAVAQAAAGAILREAGFVLEWRDCAKGCADEPGAPHIMLRIAQAPRSAVAGSLGYSVVDTQTESGTLATVFADRIASAALRTGVGMPLLLGRAIAHEIGHLLLGTSRHSASGLMRALWSDRELRRDAAGDWILSPDVVAELARRRDARFHRSAEEFRMSQR
jgi:hypothetical protein